MTPEEKAAAKAAAVAAAKAAAKAKLETAAGAAVAVLERPEEKPLSEMTDEEKKAAKAKAIAAAKAAAKAKLTAADGDAKAVAAMKAKGEQAKEDSRAHEQQNKAKRISKKMAFTVILFVTVVLASSSAFAMKLFVWNDYNDGTQLEKQYRANMQKLKETPEDLQVRYELLMAMYSKGLHEEAKVQLEYIMDHAPKDSEIMLSSIYYKALFASLAGQYEEAIAAYQQFLKAHPENGEAWLNFSFLQYSTGQYEEAAISLGTAGVLVPGSPEVPYLHGMLFIKKEQKKEAEVMFKKALELDSNHQKSSDMLKKLAEKEGK